MKNFKRIASLVLALTMILCMGITAFAATVDNKTNHTYDAYQIFSGTQAEGSAASAALGDVQWGTGVDSTNLLTALKNVEAFKDCTDAASVANVLATAPNNQDKSDLAKQFANIVANYLTTTKTAIAADATSVDLEAGYYLLVDTSTPVEGDANNSALLQVTNKGDITIEKKYTVPEPTKKIIEDDGKKDETVKSIGDTVKFELKGTLAENYADYETYKYVFHDVLSEGLTFDGVGTVSVYLGNAEGYEEDGKIASGFTVNNPAPNDGCDLEVVFADLKTLKTEDEEPLITAETVIYVTYTATLNDKAVINKDDTDNNTNKVQLEYSNNPNFDADSDNDGNPDLTPPTGKTPWDEVVVYTTEVTIVKKDGTTGNVLPGAAFQITGNSANIVVTKGEVYVAYADDEDLVEGNEYWKLTDGTYTNTDPTGENVDTTKYDASLINTVFKKESIASLDTTGDNAVSAEGFVNNTDGKLTFSGLGVGEYTIKEIVTPAGYNTVADITLTIGYDDEGEFTYTWSSGITDENNSAVVTVNNFAGSTLPETGGIGTTIFYIAGGVLLVGAAVLLITKRRMNING